MLTTLPLLSIPMRYLCNCLCICCGRTRNASDSTSIADDESYHYPHCLVPQWPFILIPSARDSTDPEREHFVSLVRERYLLYSDNKTADRIIIHSEGSRQRAETGGDWAMCSDTGREICDDESTLR